MLNNNMKNQPQKKYENCIAYILRGPSNLLPQDHYENSQFMY